MTNFKNVEPCYTGGNIYVYVGQLESGEYFLADCECAIRLLNAPMDLENEDHWYPEWQEEHLIKDLDETEGISIMTDMLKWILDNAPEGNYSKGDMMDELAFWEEVEARMACGESFDSAMQSMYL